MGYRCIGYRTRHLLTETYGATNYECRQPVIDSMIRAAIWVSLRGFWPLSTARSAIFSRSSFRTA
jgi:hypothetical protein